MLLRKMQAALLILVLTGATALDCCLSARPALAQTIAMLDKDASLNENINVKGGNKKVSLDVSGENVRTVLRDLATQAGFNLVMDESVNGNVTLELSNVSINQALQSVATLTDIHIIPQSGNIYLAISSQAAQDKGISRQLSKVIKIYYGNATRITGVLNSSIFAPNGASAGTSAGGQAVEKARADSRTNSVIIVGTAREIELAEGAIHKLDVPRQSKTFYLSNANALNVATMLASSIFNDGTASFAMGGSGGGSSSSSSGGSGSGGAASRPSTLRVEREDIQEGSGINNFGSSGGTTTSGLSSSVTLRGSVKTSDTAQISADGPLVIPDTRQNSVTIMGTAEQIAMAESLIPTLDAQLPQVAIEASLIEITSTGVRELSSRLGISDGKMQSGFNNVSLAGVTSTTGLPVAVQPASTGLIGMPTVDSSEQNPFARSGIMLSTNPLARNNDYLLQVRSLVTNNKAKILANPTVVATHDTESIISIVNEVVRRVTTTLDSSGFATQTVEIGEAGIVLDILPKVGEDGTVTMRLRPSVTTVRETRVVAGNLVTLLSKRDMLSQNVRVRDGETLAIGGLISETDTNRIDKTPFLGDAPILGALLRATQRNSERSELVLLVTPHILNKTQVTPPNTSTTSPPTAGYPVQSSMTGGEK
ncbi:MAG TPA: secretin N-terminal domain-containing protein [Coleofasciculaceae cyanobacterium]